VVRLLALVLCLGLAGCASSPVVPEVDPWHGAAHAEGEGACEGDDRCVTLVCADALCGLYRCEDAGVLLARGGGVRPPVTSSAPGFGPRRYRGNAQSLPGDREAIFVIRWYNHPAPVPLDGRKPSGSGWVKHHLYPQQDRLANFFKRRANINVHDFTMVIPRAEHVRIHGPGGRGGPWNRTWREFAEKNPLATPEQIQTQLSRMIIEFNLMGPIVPYYRMQK
jgi:uncharacterized lipoprotein (TIGR02269 family)